MTAVLTAPQGRPEHTLLWDIIPWVEDYLVQPDGDRVGEPFKFTGEQIRFLQWFYAVRPDGKWKYRSSVLERCKGWGKDPLAAVICAVELCGPCRVDFIDETGYVHGKAEPAPWVIIAAVSQTQTDNTMDVFHRIWNDAAREKYGINLGREIVYAKAVHGKLQAVTSSPRVLEGNRGTFYLRNETHHWLANNNGHEMAAVFKRNMVKRASFGAHMLDITNAPMPGEDSVHEKVYADWVKATAGKLRSDPILFDSREADPETDMTNYESLYKGLDEARGDATWLDIEATIQEIWTPSSGDEATSRRFYLNQKVAASDAWVDAQEWDACKVDAERIQLGDEITLGFDGSRTSDATALIACRISDGLIQPVEIWQPDSDNWEVPRDAVDGAVAYAFNNYRVSAFFADVNEWESYVEKWSDAYRTKVKTKATSQSSIGWDMRQNIRKQTYEYEALRAAIRDGSFKHTGDPIVRQHALNAKKKYNDYGIIPRKESRESSRKIDALAATMLSRMARNQLLETGKVTQRRGKAMFLA